MRGRGGADRDRIELQFAGATRLQAFLDRGEDENPALLPVVLILVLDAKQIRGCGIGVDDRGQTDAVCRRLDLTVDAKMVPAEGSRAEDGDARFGKQTDALARVPLRLNGAQALGVQSQKLRHLIVGLAGRTGDKSGRSRRGASRAGGRGDKLQQIQSNIFIPTSAVPGVHSLFHVLPPVPNITVVLLLQGFAVKPLSPSSTPARLILQGPR
jgi:hypothetical protein